MPSQITAMQIEREIRFAVVMYGGVSLAIYINGVAQELFQLARATATNPTEPQEPLHERLSGSAATYRWLAQLLSMDPLAQEKLERDVKADPLVLEKALAQDQPIRVKFVIDTISGTSAGGINGVFLGKALARNEDIDQLQRLWVEEGDILKLINDKESVADLDGFSPPDKPMALLNGQRMYRLLVEALDKMDPNPASQESVASGYVDELDVFVTTTDVNGLPVFLRLSDGVVTERRHKNVFQFRHRQDGPKVEKSDFGNEKNPFLAFAARCTSSFPVAFEPMRLETIGEVLETVELRRDQKKLGSDETRWKDYFPKYRATADTPPGQVSSDWYAFSKRPFCDGGYLDNKPFSYAIDMLAERAPRLPGERKLIYIEPDPERADLRRMPSVPPNALANAVLAKTLSGYETIREDLERVLDRNRLVERVERLLSETDEDVGVWRSKKLLELFEDVEEFQAGDMDSMIGHYGPAYGGYHRVKVGALTDELGDYLGAALDFDLQSAHVLGLRLLVRAWCETKYSPRKARKEDDLRETENKFLESFDLLYRIRRLRFTLRRIDSLKVKAQNARPDTAHRDLGAALKQVGFEPPGAPFSLREVSSGLDELRKGLHTSLTKLVKARNDLLFPKEKNEKNPLITEAMAEAGVRLDSFTSELRNELKKVVCGRTFEEQYDVASQAVKHDDLQKAIARIALKIEAYVGKHRKDSKESCKAAFASMLQASSDWAHSAVKLIKSYYDNYQGYDFVSFPVVYATGVGEEIATTEVIRISPEDAKTLVKAGDGRKKLAGTEYHHFGAFFDKGWRKNDMLWGRLDGAERLITSLLPQKCKNLTAALVRDAQRRILEEYYQTMSRKAVLGFTSDIVAKFPQQSPDAQRMRKYIQKQKDAKSPHPELDKQTRAQLGGVIKESPLNPALVEEVLRQQLGTDNLLKFWASPDGYEVDRELTPRTAAQALSRAATVFGKILDGIGDQYNSKRVRALGTWLSRLGRVFWGLVEIATPRSLPQLLGRHAIQVAYLLEVLIILGGLGLGHADATKLGWILLVLTITLNFVWWVIYDWLRGRRAAVFTAKVLAGVVVGGLALFGAYRMTTDFPVVRQFLCSTAGLDC